MPGLHQSISPPNSRELLPPLLACLSTANHSQQIPPGLLPLLSPILRQRVQLLASKDWISLLCWDREIGSKLPQIIEKLHVEPHPSSGEIEVEDPDQIVYRRSDPETLHSRLVLGEFGLLPTYIWCTGGESGNRWSLAELRGTEDADDGTEWFTTMGEADEAGFRRKTVQSSGAVQQPQATLRPEPAREEEDDGSYWAAYDQTPSQTPALKRSPAPPSNGRTQIGPTQSELEYFSRYASEVQPALDAHDPDEVDPAVGESTLKGDTLDYARAEPLEHSNFAAHGDDVDARPDTIEALEAARLAAMSHPRPTSSASTNSVERLERKAERHSQAEHAIKQHISTDIKSLFRLARASGIDREEFERIIQRELEVLPMLEQED